MTETAINQVAVIEADFSATESAINELQKTYGTEVPDASTKDGYDRCKQIIGECKSLRSSLEYARKVMKQPHLDAGRQIDAEAKRITEILKRIELPFSDAKSVVDDENKVIKAKLEFYKNISSWAVDKSSSEIADMIDELGCVDLGEFGKQQKKAVELIKSANEILIQRHAQAVISESDEIEELCRTVVTINSNKDLFKTLCECCEFDTSEIPKHGKGYVLPTAEIDGVYYEFSQEVVWDYSYGIDDFDFELGHWIEKYIPTQESKFNESVADLVAVGVDESTAMIIVGLVAGGSVRNMTFG